MPSEIHEVTLLTLQENKEPCSLSSSLSVPLRFLSYRPCILVLFDHLRISCQGLTSLYQGLPATAPALWKVAFDSGKASVDLVWKGFAASEPRNPSLNNYTRFMYFEETDTAQDNRIDWSPGTF
jgi:hypothetical protein